MNVNDPKPDPPKAPQPSWETVMNCLRLPQSAWDLISAHAETLPSFPPAHKGRSSVILQVFKRIKPPEGAESIYENLYGSRFEDLHPGKVKK